MNNKNKHATFANDHIDDYNVLNYLLEHVRGLRPSSLTPEYAFDDSAETE